MVRNIFVTVLMLCCMWGCTPEVENAVDIQEVAQQVGDVMASVDELGGTTDGTYATLEGHRRFIAEREGRMSGSIVMSFLDLIQPLPAAQAVGCQNTTFTACVGSQKSRDLGGCTIGSAVFTGSIDLTFSENDCLLNASSESVDRAPDFTVTGRRSATLTVSKEGVQGQRLIRGITAGTFTLSNDGIRRSFAAGGSTLFDFTTTTTAPININGANRNNRTVSGGTLRVTNNLTSVYCDYVPSGVTWESNDNNGTYKY